MEPSVSNTNKARYLPNTWVRGWHQTVGDGEALHGYVINALARVQRGTRLIHTPITILANVR